jgi:very-short-patch-repair endonuclease
MRLTPIQRERSRQLRATMTDAERKLWSVLRDRQLEGLRFRRQFPLKQFIVDFVCLEVCLIVEVDGGQHDEQRTDDTARDRLLKERGFQVMRVWNNDVMKNIEGVAEAILQAARHPHPVLPPSRGKGRSLDARAHSDPLLPPSRGKGRALDALQQPKAVLPRSKGKERTAEPQ